LLLLLGQERRYPATRPEGVHTWDPSQKIETFTVQPKFEGNTLDFGMVIPTPSQPKLNEMPRDFFKHLAVKFSGLGSAWIAIGADAGQTGCLEMKKEVVVDPNYGKGGIFLILNLLQIPQDAAPAFGNAGHTQMYSRIFPG
jgi:hypothetical protein